MSRESLTQKKKKNSVDEENGMILRGEEYAITKKRRIFMYLDEYTVIVSLSQLKKKKKKGETSLKFYMKRDKLLIAVQTRQLKEINSIQFYEV